MANTKSHVCYNQNLLDTCAVKDEAQVIGTYGKLTRDIDVKFKCKCGEQSNKTFRCIVENGGLRCKECSVKVKTTKMKQTLLNTYGVDNPMRVQEFKMKVRERQVTFTLERLKEVVGDYLVGEYDKNIINRETIITFHCICCNQTHVKTFRMIEEGGGLVCRECCDAGKYEKIRQSIKAQHGVEYSLQVPELNDKATFKGLKYKKYIGPSGKIYNCQGYEPYGLDLLFIEYKDEDIITAKKKVPEIWWVDGDGQEHRYYVDIYIPKEKRMIEVKSDYRYKMDKEKLEFVWRTCVEQGYNYEVWIFNKDHEIVELKLYSSSSLNASTSTSSKLFSSSSDR